MYNRYIPQDSGYARVTRQPPPPHKPPFQGIFSGTEGKDAGVAGILKMLHLQELDSGDLLLLLIILFLVMEGDNLEIAITLGLMLLLGAKEERTEKDEHQKE